MVLPEEKDRWRSVIVMNRCEIVSPSSLSFTSQKNVSNENDTESDRLERGMTIEPDVREPLHSLELTSGSEW